MTHILLSIGLFLSLSLNAGLFFFLQNKYHSHLKIKNNLIHELQLELEKKSKRTQSIELQEFLADLLTGPALLAVARMDPSNILLRSPKQR